MTVALGGACVNGGKFCCSEYLALTNTIFFSIYFGSIAAGLCIPWAYSTCCQLVSMQHGVLLLIKCMRSMPEPGLPGVILLVFRRMLILTFPRLLAGLSTIVIVAPSTTKCELQFLCPYTFSSCPLVLRHPFHKIFRSLIMLIWM